MTFSVRAQEIVFSASVNKKQVALNDYVQLTYTIKNAELNQFQQPDFSKFKILSGPNQSTSMQIVNGRMSSSLSLSYLLQPKQVGKITIVPAKFTYKGKNFESNSVTVEAVKAANGGNNQSSGGQQSQGNTIADNVYIRAFVDKSSVYQGEQVTVTFKLYTRLQIVNYGVDKMPAFTGFWSNDIEYPQQLTAKKEMVDGVAFNVATIRKVALFPQRDGTLSIDPLEMEAAVRIKQQNNRKRRSVFDDFFFDDFFGGYKDVKHKMRTNKINVKVKPLPRKNKPSNFTGAVGQFSFDTELSESETKVNEPLSFKIKISGTGNVKLVDAPEIDLPKDFEAYDPKITENFPKGSNPVRGSKTYEYLLIPRRPGEYRLPSVYFSYFDTKKKDYVRVQSPEYTIKVAKGDGEYVSNNQVTGISKENIELLGQDIRYIKINSKGLKEKGKVCFGSPLFFLLLGLPFLLLAVLVFLLKRQNKLRSNTTLLKSKKATGIAKKKLKIAKKYMAEGDKKAFYDEVVKALWGYLGDRFNIPTAMLSKDKVRDVLGDKKVSEEDLQRLFETIDECEMALFAPSSSSDALEKTYSGAIDLISTIESKI